MSHSSRAFIISLEGHSHPRVSELRSRLEGIGLEVELIESVRGRTLDAGTYFDRIQHYRIARGHTMTPAELGCALGHAAAVQKIVEYGLSRALVFEDDALLDEASCVRLRALLDQDYASEGLLLLGGQEGLEHLITEVHGKLCDPVNEVWELFEKDLGLVYRAVGYMVSASQAVALSDLAARGAYVVDDFAYVAAHSPIKRFFLANCVGHPRDLSGSTIEKDREANRQVLRANSRPLLTRLRAEVEATLAGRSHWRQYKRASASLERVRWISRF